MWMEFIVLEKYPLVPQHFRFCDCIRSEQTPSETDLILNIVLQKCRKAMNKKKCTVSLDALSFVTSVKLVTIPWTPSINIQC